MKIKNLSVLLLIFLLSSCNYNGQNKKTSTESTKISTEINKEKAVAVFAEGCFWCSEHIFEAVVGVEDAVSGYTAGNTKNPTYEEVSSHTTGHAEAIMVYYDPKVISFKELVAVFFDSHDPTTLNQQGPDIGDSYRSIAFYKNAEEKKIIEDKIKELTKTKVFRNPIVTEVKPIADFYKAEEYHQDYINNNPNNSYVKGVSIPRYNDFKKKYKGKLKPNH